MIVPISFKRRSRQAGIVGFAANTNLESGSMSAIAGRLILQLQGAVHLVSCRAQSAPLRFSATKQKHAQRRREVDDSTFCCDVELDFSTTLL